MRVLIVTAMYPSPEKPSSGTFVKEQVDSLSALGMDVDVFAFYGNGSAANYLKAAITLPKILKQKRYDIVHAHYGLTGAVAVLQRKCPVVITYHGSDLLGVFDYSRKKYTLGGKIRTLISRAAGFGAAERIVVANILKPKLSPQSAVTIPMGVDLSLFYPMPRQGARKMLGLPADTPLVLFVANPRVSEKRFDIAQEAVRILKESIPGADLIAVYNRPHDQVPMYMNACDVLVLTSMHEASPCVIKEALACGLPIVSVDVGDVAERIEGVEGCYLSERDPCAIAERLCLVLTKGQRLKHTGGISELSLPNIAYRVRDVYEKVMAGRS